MPKSVPVLVGVVQSIEDCKDCQGLKKIHAMTKNRKNIKATINRHRYEVHGIPIPQQQQQRPSKKPKKIQTFIRWRIWWWSHRWICILIFYFFNLIHCILFYFILFYFIWFYFNKNLKNKIFIFNFFYIKLKP